MELALYKYCNSKYTAEVDACEILCTREREKGVSLTLSVTDFGLQVAKVPLPAAPESKIPPP